MKTILLSVCAGVSLGMAAAWGADALPARLSFGEGTPDVTTVTWDTADVCRGAVEYWPAAGGATNVARDGGGVVRHVVSLRGLAPNTKFSYRTTGGAGGASAVRSFWTPPAAGDLTTPVRFCMRGDLQGGIGDAAERLTWGKEVSDGIADYEPTFVLAPGDLADEAYETHGTRLAAWSNFFRCCTREIGTTHFMTSQGNHDYASNSPALKESTGQTFDGKRGWIHRVFTYPEPRGPAELSYAFSAGAARVVVLNSDADIPAQNDLLERELQRGAYDTNCAFLILVEHRPPYSGIHYEGNAEVKTNWLYRLAMYEGDLVVSGHVHAYQRYLPRRGVTALVTGGGGAYLVTDPAGTDQADGCSTTCCHFVRATMTGAGISCEAVRSDGQVFDRFSVTPHRQVRVSPAFPTAGGTATVRFAPATAPNGRVFLHWGTDDWAGVGDTEMSQGADGAFTAQVQVPATAARRLVFCFKDVAGGTTNWLNNYELNWQALLDDGAVPPDPMAPQPTVLEGSPVVTEDPPGGAMNNASDAFDFATNGVALRRSPWAQGFGDFGRVWVNADAQNLYVGGQGMELPSGGNVAAIFLGLGSLTDDAENLWHLSGLPEGLDKMHNVRFVEPMDVAILLGDQYGDKVAYTNFTVGGDSGPNLGQGIYYLARSSGKFSPMTGATLSQFTEPNPTAATGRMTTHWEARLPWSALNASYPPAEDNNLFLCGVIASGSTSGDDRYLSRSLLAARGYGMTDIYGNHGFSTVTLDPHRVHFASGDFLGDGVKNGFRQEFYGTVAGPAADSDTDGDGADLLREFRAGTDPTDPASDFVVSADGSGAIEAPASGRTYVLERSTNLLESAAGFVPVATNAGAARFDGVEAGPGATFYRMRVE